MQNVIVPKQKDLPFNDISKANLLFKNMRVTYWFLKSNFLLLRCLSNGLHAFLYLFLLSNPLRKGRCTSFLLCYKHRNALGLSTFQNSYNNVSPFSSNGYRLSFLLVIDFLLYLLLLCFLINPSPTPTILGLISCFSFTLQVFAHCNRIIPLNTKRRAFLPFFNRLCS